MAPEAPPPGIAVPPRAGSARSRLGHALRALENRNFRLFVGGQVISLVGTWMQSVAQAWLVYRLTGSSLLLGAVAFISQVPVPLFAPLGGIAADRFSRKRVVIATQTAAMLLAAILAALTLSGRIQVPHLMVLSACLGVVNAFDIPARQALVIDLVGGRDIISAVALNSSVFNGARIAGPALAGVLVGLVGEGWCFFANAVSFVPVILGLALIDLREPKRPSASSSALEDIKEGLRFTLQAEPVRALLLLLGLVSLVGMPYAVLMPVFADRVLGGGARGMGLLLAASGLGALIGSGSLLLRSGSHGLARLAAVAAAGFGGCLLLFSFSRSFWLSAVLLVPIGAFLMLQMACSNTLIQSMAPDALRGRVMSIYSMMLMGMAPFGSLWAGAAADALGAPATVAVSAVGCLAATAWFAFRLPALRPELRRLLLAQEAVHGVPSAELGPAS